MDVTLLYFDDCPNWKIADEHLEQLARDLPHLRLSRHLVATPEEAERLGFRGSPSVLVDGVDVFADADAPVGLSCRVYQTPDGPVGSPTLDQLRAVLLVGDRRSPPVSPVYWLQRSVCAARCRSWWRRVPWARSRGCRRAAGC